MAFINHHVQDHMVFVFGILGNIVSFLVYLAPLPTFLRIYKKKSTEGFQSIPYAVALFSAMLTLYYGFLKPNGILLITINTVGIVIESAYILLFIIYAPKDAKICTGILLVLFNGVFFGMILFTTMMFFEETARIEIVGWTCAVFSVCVFIAPLSIMRLVIRTKSVEFMPLSLSFFLTICAVMWFFYGFLVHDFFVAIPNVLGFAFGIVQMVLYMIYKKTHAILPVTKSEIELEVDTKKSSNEQASNYSAKPADADLHQEVVVVTDSDDKEVTTCNTLVVEY